MNHPYDRVFLWPGGADLDRDVLYSAVTGNPIRVDAAESRSAVKTKSLLAPLHHESRDKPLGRGGIGRGSPLRERVGFSRSTGG